MAKRMMYSVNFKTGKKRLMATFELLKGKVTAEYEVGQEGLQKDIEGGLIMSKGVPLRPQDGKTFYDALRETYSQSSSVSVEDTK